MVFTFLVTPRKSRQSRPQERTLSVRTKLLQDLAAERAKNLYHTEMHDRISAGRARKHRGEPSTEVVGIFAPLSEREAHERAASFWPLDEQGRQIVAVRRPQGDRLRAHLIGCNGEQVVSGSVRPLVEVEVEEQRVRGEVLEAVHGWWEGELPSPEMAVGL